MISSPRKKRCDIDITCGNGGRLSSYDDGTYVFRPSQRARIMYNMDLDSRLLWRLEWRTS